MANRKTRPATIDGPQLEQMTEETRAEVAASTALVAQHVQAVELNYGDGEEYNLERSVAKVQAYLAASADNFLQAGRELIRIKEHEVGHGEFARLVETRFGLEPRAAQRMMQAALKFLNSDGTRRPLLADMTANKTKIIELLTLDDDDIELLERGETVAGLDRDDIRDMSTTELRKALRVAREEKAADDAVISQKEGHISKLEREIKRLERGGRELEERAYMAMLTEVDDGVVAMLRELERVMPRLAEFTELLRSIEVPSGIEDLQKRMTANNYLTRLRNFGDSVARVLNDAELNLSHYEQEGRQLLPGLADE